MAMADKTKLSPTVCTAVVYLGHMMLSSDLEVGRAHVVRRHRSVRRHSAVYPATQRRERAVSAIGGEYDP